MADAFTSTQITVTAYCGPFAVGIYGPNPYYIPPANYPTQKAASDVARTVFKTLGLELGIFATNGIKPFPKRLTLPNKWTIIDRITATSYAVNQQTVYELATSQKPNPAGTGPPEGDEPADDDYILQADITGRVTVYYVPANGAPALPALGEWVFRTGGTGSYDAPGANSRDYSMVGAGTLIEAQDASAETPVLSIFAGNKVATISNVFFGGIVHNAGNETLSQHGTYSLGDLGYESGKLRQLTNFIPPNTGLITNAELTRLNVQWAETQDGYGPYTKLPVVMGSIDNSDFITLPDQLA